MSALVSLFPVLIRLLSLCETLERMHFSHLLAAGLLPWLVFVSAGSLSPRAVQCYFEVPAASGDTCEGIAST